MLGLRLGLEFWLGLGLSVRARLSIFLFLHKIVSAASALQYTGLNHFGQVGFWLHLPDMQVNKIQRMK